ncbi:unnamed protein product [Brassica rapa]|uniref:Uncharacterized protein n=1 Tax=Brassica campestris TaxID=3711 RepID=A0A3P5ZHI5_BRACM|nr:unnamed protein product [Brassica rapa]VDC73823.1 unnamed protein product [Brassica rapa]
MEKCTKNKSSHSQLYGPLQECGLASSSCCYVIVALPSHYAVSSIDGFSQSQPALWCPHPYPCRKNYCARVWTRQIYSFLCHRCVSITLCRLKHRRFFTESSLRLSQAVIFYGVSRNSCFQNPLVGLFNVDFDLCAFLRTRALGLQVKCLYGSLLSLATSIFRHVLVYQFIVENLSSCNRLSPLGL